MPNQTEVLILQHPQEPDKLLGSARIANLALEKSTLKVGLSWPNLAKALGRPTEPSKWGVLYLGSRQENEKLDHSLIADKAGRQYTADEAGLEGIVVLDGNWSQAKAMWWRNPWLLKLKRVVLVPKQKSLYGDLRREPRRECLSTIESIAEALELLNEAPEIGHALREHFGQLLAKYKETYPKGDPATLQRRQRRPRWRRGARGRKQ